MNVIKKLVSKKNNEYNKRTHIKSGENSIVEFPDYQIPVIQLDCGRFVVFRALEWAW